MDALIPFITELNFAEWETEVIPAEKLSDWIQKAEKVLAEMAGS